MMWDLRNVDLSKPWADRLPDDVQFTGDVTKAGPADEQRDEHGRWTSGGGQADALNALRQEAFTHLSNFPMYRDGYGSTHNLPAEAARLAGMPLNDYLQKVDRNLQGIIDHAKPWIRVDSAILGKVMEEGRFKSQFESHDSSGNLNPDLRAQVEDKAFGYGGLSTGIAEDQRPVYGYMADAGDTEGRDGDVSNYGDTRVLLTDGAKERATVTFGDSLAAMEQGQMAPSPVHNVLGTSVDDAAWATAAGLRAQNTETGPAGWTSITDMHVLSPISYVEAQYHGGLSVKDIAEVVFPIYFSPGYREAQGYGTPDRSVLETQARLEASLRAARIPYRYATGAEA